MKALAIIITIALLLLSATLFFYNLSGLIQDVNYLNAFLTGLWFINIVFNLSNLNKLWK